jgi:spore photoproduct lyase
LWQPARIIVDERVADHPVARRIVRNCLTKECHVVDLPNDKTADREILTQVLNLPDGTTDSKLTSLGRTSLLLTRSDQLIQQMAAGPAWERRCFNFLKIMPYTGVCPYNCAYCWFKDPVLIPRVNVAFFDLLPAVLEELRQARRTPTVFTFTHYKTDCFTMEHLTGFCRTAAEFFEKCDGFALQFLTKSDLVDGLLTEPVPAKCVVTFSINAPYVVRNVDLGTPLLADRLAAARRLKARGIPVMLRVDPMMWFDGWRDEYDSMVNQVLAAFEPDHVTLGTPRFQDEGELATVVRQTASKRARTFLSDQARLMGVNKPGTPDADGAFKSYFANMSVSYSDSVRAELYSFVYERFREMRPDLSIGLCEEPGSMWARVGIDWSGDKSTACSCNFVTSAFRKLFAPDEQLRVLMQAQQAREAARLRDRETGRALAL